MGKKEQAGEAKDAAFKRLYGVKPETFEQMKDILQKALNKLHKSGGRPPKLTAAGKLAAALKYLREYRTMESIAADYGAAKSRICETIQWVEDTLAKDKTFKLPGRRVLKGEAPPIDYIAVDVTESPINRPKKTKKSGIPAKRSGIL
jgi:transcription initiation factor TFIIIB Brf1 subunit/transcription initiation factor TFIIB